MEYTLFLDESGDFKETAKMPSVVAGYLVRGIAPCDNWAQKVLREVKASSPMFDKINIDKFHGMLDYSEPMQEFCVRIMEKLKSNKIKLISFQNKKNAKIVDSDTTYLNVFALGLVRLFEKLLIAKKGNVTINVVYASRISVAEKDFNNRFVQIQMLEYKKKIEEHLALKMAQWPNQYRQKFNYTLKVASATKSPLLMLADAINFGVRGGYQNFNSERKERVRSLVTVYKVHSGDKWTAIKNNFVRDNLAAGVISWYGDNDKELEGFAKEFEDILCDALSSMNAKLFSIQYKILSSYLSNIISQRSLAYAKSILTRLRLEFIPMLERSDKDSIDCRFDLAFQMFTVASHKGDNALAAKCIAECDACLEKMNFSYEALDYYFSYRIRVVEHLKNLFLFKDALAILEKLEASQQKLIDACAQIGDIHSSASQIRSVTLGKIWGSMLQVYSQLVNKEPEVLEKGRGITRNALEQFGDSFVDKSRIMQSRAALEYSAGNFDEALKWIAMSLGLDDNASAVDVLANISRNPRENAFIIMHYAKLMGKAARDGDPAARTLYIAWEKNKIEALLPKKSGQAGDSACAEYPYYVIYWNAAAARSVLAAYDKNNFRIAECGALANPAEITVYAAGLAAAAEKLYYNIGNIPQKDLDDLSRLVKSFKDSCVPDNFKTLFAAWEEVFSNEQLQRSVRPEERGSLRKLVDSIPVV